jgi:cytolysin (calcineurin-like family phosphatase)
MMLATKKATLRYVESASPAGLGFLKAALLAFILALVPSVAFGQGTPAASDFYMIFASDTQYPWSDLGLKKTGQVDLYRFAKNDEFATRKNDKGEDVWIRVPEKEEDVKAPSEKLNRDQVKSMQTLAGQLGRSQVKGVIINGDLTAFGNDWQLDKYKQIWDQGLGLPIYPGLGNHDYDNNVNNSFENNCANRMVKYMHEFVQKLPVAAYDFRESGQYYKFPELRNDYKGSLSYSWDIGDVHFVQLHNYPAYVRSWNGWNFGGARREFFEITSSMDWLRNDLAIARNAGKKIILNMHDCGDCFYDKHRVDYDKCVKMLGEFKVSAVFAGHIHEDVGYVESLGGVPLFRSGAPSYSNYLLARFSGNNLIVETVSSKDGAATRSAVGTYRLHSDRPSTPSTPASVDPNRPVTRAQFESYLAQGLYSYEIKEFTRGERVAVGAGVGGIHKVLRWARTGQNDQRFLFLPEPGGKKFRVRTLREDVGGRLFVAIAPTGAAITWSRSDDNNSQVFQIEWLPDGRSFALREGTKGEFLDISSGGDALRWSGVDGRNDKPKPNQLFQFLNPRVETGR